MLDKLPPRERQIVDLLYARGSSTVAEICDALPVTLSASAVRAMLARLDLTPAEKAQFSRQLGDVLHHIEQLAKVDVAGIEPTAHAFPVVNVWADDVARPGLPVDAALANAPAQRDHMIVVPKVVE